MEVAWIFLVPWEALSHTYLDCLNFVINYCTTMEYKLGLRSSNYWSADHLKEKLREDFLKNMQSLQFDGIEVHRMGPLRTQPSAFLAGIALGE